MEALADHLKGHLDTLSVCPFPWPQYPILRRACYRLYQLIVRIAGQETAALLRLFIKFPTGINRESLSKNRHFSANNRELG